MPLVAAKCTQCGANLQIDSSKEAAICPNCNTPFVSEKAITNYKTYHEYKIEKADVHIHDEKSIEIRLKNAEIFFKKHNNIDKAYELFHSVTNDAPGDYRGWWGLVRVRTDDFHLSEISRKELDNLNYYTACAFNVAPSDVVNELEQVWQTYTRNINELHNRLSQLKTTETDISDLQKRINRLSGEIRNADSICDYYKKIKTVFLLIFAIIGVFSFISFIKNVAEEINGLLALSICGLTIATVCGFFYLVFCLKFNKETRLNRERKMIKEEEMNVLANYHKAKAALQQQIDSIRNMLS